MNYIYKYQSASELKLASLRRGEIFFAAINELNDGHEGKPALVISGNLAVYNRFFEWLVVELMHHTFIASENSQQMVNDLILNLARQIKKNAKRKDISIDEVWDSIDTALNEIEMDVDFINRVKRILRKAPDFLRHQVDDYVNSHYSTASFSTVGLNPTMWGHYGDADKGFVTCYLVKDNSVSVEFTEPRFTVSRKVERNLGSFTGYVTEIGFSAKGNIELEKVTYSNKRAKVNLAHVFSNQFFFSEIEQHYDYDAEFRSSIARKQFEKFLLFKSLDWRYEKEVRLVHSGADLPEHRLGVLGGLDSVILGFNTNQFTSSRIIECIKQFVTSKNSLAPSSVAVFRTLPNSTSYEYGLTIEGEVRAESKGFAFKAYNELEEATIKRLSTKLEMIQNKKTTQRSV